MDGEGAGKGDTPRPVDKKVYDENFDSIDWHRETNDSTELRHGRRGPRSGESLPCSLRC